MRFFSTALLVSAVMAQAALGVDVPLGPGTPQPPAEVKPAAPRGSLVEWRADLDAAVKEAVAADRMVLVYFRADWCKPCDLMDGGPFGIPIFVRYLAQNFVAVKADDTREPSEISKKFQVRLYPTVLFLSSAGEPLHMVLGPRTAPELYAVMKQVRALPALIEAARKSPDDLEANFSLATMWVDLGHLRKAEPLLRRAADLDPKNEMGRRAQAALLLAVVPTEDGEPETALKNIDSWMEEYKDSPEMPSALFFRGTILQKDGKLLEARRVYDDLRTRFPQSLKAYEADKAIDAIDARIKALQDEIKRAAEAKAAAKAEKETGTKAEPKVEPKVEPKAPPQPAPAPTPAPK
jgi:thiol-disulfide isomerase/thioredoxin